MGPIKALLLWWVMVAWILGTVGGGMGAEGALRLQGIDYEDHFTFGRVVLRLNRPADFQVERTGKEVLVKLPSTRLPTPSLCSVDLSHPDGTRLVPYQPKGPTDSLVQVQQSETPLVRVLSGKIE